MLQVLITLPGAVALLLWGTHMVQTGVQRAFGPSLRNVLGRALRNRLYAFGAGIGVTAVLQSSTATGLIIAGFTSAGMVELMPALAVMLGANVGTTLIVQVLSFDISAATPAFILVGVVLFRRYRTNRLHDMGRIFIGLGLMLLALHGLLEAMTPLEDGPALRRVIDVVSAVPLLAVLFAALLTWTVHSSVAIILVVMSLAGRGVMDPEIAFAFVLGANLGTAINPVFEGASGSDLASKRLPIGNLLSRVAGVGIVVLGLTPLTQLFLRLAPDAAHAVADFHTAFNVGLALLLLPCLVPYARLLTRHLPARVDPADPSQPLYLDPAATETPIVAIAAASREALRLTDMLDTMLARAGDSLGGVRRQNLAESKKLGQYQRSLGLSIQSYLTMLDLDGLSDADRQRLSAVFAFVGNIQCAATVVDKGLQRLVTSRMSSGFPIDAAERSYLDSVLGRIRTNVRTTAALLMTDDPAAAHALADEKRTFRKLEEQANRLHFDQLRAGVIDSSFRLDLIRELKMINAYLVAAAAYPLLERHGGLLESRVAAVA